jgi:hypothetical protein
MATKFANMGTGTAQASAMVRFATLLANFRSTACSDDKDRVFALRAMVFRRTQAMSELLVRYEDRVESIYQNTTVKILSATQSIDMLGHTCTSLQYTDPAFPSWVPDLRIGAKSALLYNLRRGGTDMYEGGELMEFRACSTLSAPFAIVDNHIRCAGALFDEIADIVDDSGYMSIGKPLEALQWLRKAPADRCRPLETLHGSLTLDTGPKQRPGTLRDHEYGFIANILWLTASRLHDQPPIEQEEVQARLIAVEEELANLQPLKELDLDPLIDQARIMVSGDDPRASRAKIKGLIDTWLAFQQVAKLPLSGRYLFRTRRGLLGWGYDTVLKGDQVWVLADGSVPFVLRPAEKEGEYRFYGDSFILDHLHGEIMSDRYNLQDKVQQIKII